MFDDKADLRPLDSGEVRVGGAPEGFDALLLARLVARAQLGAHKGPALHVARDDQRAAALAEALAVVAPELLVLRFPAWDCLPYDRVSPNPEIVAERMATLAALAEGFDAPALVLSTVNAVTQRVPPSRTIYDQSWTGEVGGRCDLEELTGYLTRNGYRRASTVAERGDFAVRGGVVDLFPPAAADPVRLDLFGDVLETARRFDADSQRTIEKIRRVELAPISETLLDADSVQRFRIGYREAFGASGGSDPLYAAVSEGRRFQGMEHWLPFFHETLETIFDYLPKALVSFDHLADDARVKRWETVQDHYQARRQAFEEAAPSAGLKAGQVYKPAPPELMYLDDAAFAAALDGRAIRRFSPHRAPPGPGVTDAGGKIGRSFVDERRAEDGNLFNAFAMHLTDLRAAGKRVVVASWSEGARDRLSTVLSDHGFEDLALAESWRDVADPVALLAEHRDEIPAAVEVGHPEGEPGRRAAGPPGYFERHPALWMESPAVHARPHPGQPGGGAVPALAGVHPPQPLVRQDEAHRPCSLLRALSVRVGR